MRAHFLVSVGGKVVTHNFLPKLLAVSITKGTDKTADTANFTLDDSGGNLRWPETGTPVHIELGREGGAIRSFDGEVDTASWDLSRGGGSVMTIAARSVSLKGKAKQQVEKHWEKKPLSTILKEAGNAAGISTEVHPDLADIIPDWEAMDGESFLQFGERLAREYGAIFQISGTRGVFVPFGLAVSGAALSMVSVTRDKLLSASGFAPTTDRPRIKAQTETFYDLDEAKRLAERYASGDTVDAESQAQFSAPDKSTATGRAKAKTGKANRDKATGTVTINGDANAQPGGKAILSGLRAGVDGTYTITSVSDELSRSSGYTTTLSLGEPQGSAGADKR